MDDEMRSHLELMEEAFLESGMSAEEAHRQALQKFGNLERMKEDAREIRSFVWLEQLFTDILQSLRGVAAAKVFFITSVTTLALAIGVCVASFSLANPILFKPLNFPDSSSLVFLEQRKPDQGLDSIALSYADFVEIRKSKRVLEDVGVYRLSTFTFLHEGKLERLTGSCVSPGLFPLLRVPCFIGSHFSESNERQGQGDVCILSYRFWQSHFSGDAKILGKEIFLDGRRVTVQGVMPESFAFQGGGAAGAAAEFWLPQPQIPQAQSRGAHEFLAIGRLRNGVTQGEAELELSMISRRLMHQQPGFNTGIDLRMTALHEKFLDSKLRLICWAVLGSVLCALAVACSNVANLFLARTMARRKEFAIREALGAGRARITQRLLCEGFLVALSAGLLGLALAKFILVLFLSQVRETIPHWLSFPIDWASFLLVALIIFLSCVLFGLAPAWRLGTGKLRSILDAVGRGKPDHPEQSRIRALLIFCQIALASLLLCSALSLASYVVDLDRVDLGFNPNNLHVVEVSVPIMSGEAPRKVSDHFGGVLKVLSEGTQLESAAASSCSFGSDNLVQSFHIEGSALSAKQPLPVARLRVCTPDYFRTMGIPLFFGRDFAWSDAGGPGVMIVDISFAQSYFGRANPLGRRVRLGLPPSAPVFEVIGVAGNVHYRGAEFGAQPGFYLPHWMVSFPSLFVHMRSRPDFSDRLDASVSTAMNRVDQRLTAGKPVLVSDRVDGVNWRRRFVVRLVGALAFFALILCSVGISGFVAYSVIQQRREIGLRIALGAMPGSVVFGMTWRFMALVFSGLVSGALVSLFVERHYWTHADRDESSSLAILGLSTLLIALLSSFACLLPAYKMARTSPAETLRTGE